MSVCVRPTQPRCSVYRADVLNQPVRRRRLGKVKLIGKQTTDDDDDPTLADVQTRSQVDVSITYIHIYYHHNILITIQLVYYNIVIIIVYKLLKKIIANTGLQNCSNAVNIIYIVQRRFYLVGYQKYSAQTADDLLFVRFIYNIIIYHFDNGLRMIL